MSTLDVIVVDTSVFLASADKSEYKDIDVANRQQITKEDQELVRNLLDRLYSHYHVYKLNTAAEVLSNSLIPSAYDRIMDKIEHYKDLAFKNRAFFNNSLNLSRDTFSEIKNILKILHPEFDRDGTISESTDTAERNVCRRFLRDGVGKEDVLLVALTHYLVGAIRYKIEADQVSPFIVTLDQHMCETSINEYVCDLVPETIRERTGILCVTPEKMLTLLYNPLFRSMSTEEGRRYIGAGVKALEIIGKANKILESSNKSRRRR